MNEPTRDRGMALRERHPDPAQRDDAMGNLLGAAAVCLSAELVPEALVTIIVRIPGHPEGDALIANGAETLPELQALIDRTAERVRRTQEPLQ